MFVVPEGELFRIAWLALPLHTGTLVESGIVPHVLNSERNLDTTTRRRPMQSLLLVGAVPSEAEAACGHFFTDLPGARLELDELRKLWLESGNSANSVVDLVGNDANKSAVLAAIQKSGIIHFATHAFTGVVDCTKQQPPRSRGVEIVASSRIEINDSQAKLLLAGDARLLATQADRELTATEIATLRLDNAGLVTLSACDTGLGPVTRDEGVFGLARAFHLAGAQDVVMSLWDVNDEATEDLMTRMYRVRWANQMATAAALAHASLETMVTRRVKGQSVHPFYWAAFIADEN